MKPVLCAIAFACLILGIIFVVLQKRGKMSDHRMDIQFVVQFKVNGMGTPENLAAGHIVENRFGRILEEARVGFADGTDIGSGSMNIFFYVSDPFRALEFVKKGLPEKYVVAYRNKEDRYVVLWPKNYDREFDLK